VNNAEFIDAVSRRAQMPSERAESLTRATLETLTDRITAGQASRIGRQLPAGLREHLHKTTSAVGAQIAESFGEQEFIDRVAARAGVDVDTADVGMRAVLSTIGEVVSNEELQDMLSQLPKEFWDYIQAGARVEVRPRGA
jgi:uncharacterized protein (DUF2267 family)